MTPIDNDKELIEQYYKTQDPNLREDIILRYIPLVHFTLGRMGMSSDIGNEYEDMTSQGLIGLIDAIDRFDLSFGTQFSTYAIIKIRGKILDYMRSLDWLTRTARKRAKIITDGINTYWGENQRMPNDSELAKHLNMDISQVQTALIDSSRVIVSIDAFDDFEYSGEASLHETIADDTQVDPAELLLEEDTKRRLIEVIKNLPERDQLLLSLYYYDNLTLKEIGEVLDISESRVCQLHGRATLNLKAQMTIGEDDLALMPNNNLSSEIFPDDIY